MKPLFNVYRGLILLMAMLPGLALGATSTADDLVSLASQQMQISHSQASGGLGVLFQMAKQNLNPDQFGTIEKQVPDMSGLLAAGKQALALQQSTRKNSTLGKAMSMFSHSPGAPAGPVSAFNALQSLGFSAGGMSTLINLVEDYLKSRSGSNGVQPASLFSQGIEPLLRQPGVH